MVNEGSPPAAPPAGSPGHPAMVVIDRFTGDQGWPSNSAAGQVFIGGKVYPTREHAFQVAKTLDLDQRARIAGAATSADAHRLGQAVTLRPGWDDHVRYAVMWQVLASALDNNPGLGPAWKPPERRCSPAATPTTTGTGARCAFVLITGRSSAVTTSDRH